MLNNIFVGLGGVAQKIKEKKIQYNCKWFKMRGKKKKKLNKKENKKVFVQNLIIFVLLPWEILFVKDYNKEWLPSSNSTVMIN